MAKHLNSKKIKALFRNKIFIAFFIVACFLAMFYLLRSSGKKAESSTYRIALSEEWNSTHLNGREKSFLGLINDLMAEIAQKQNLKFQMLLTSSNNLLSGLDLQQYDAILSGITPTLDNRSKYIHSNTIYLTGPLLVVQANSPIKSLAEMSEKRVGILTGSSVVFNLQHYPDILFTSYNSVMDALTDLEKNQIDGVIIDAVLAHTYISTIFAGKLKVVSSTLTDEGVRLIAKKDARNEELINQFNEGLKKVKDDGTYDTLLNKWRLFTIP